MGVYSAVDDDNFRAIVSARGPTGRLAMIPDYLVVCSMYGMAMWWCMLLLVHVRNIVGSAIIIGLLLAIVTFLVSYSSYAARIIYHSGAHKPESIFQETAPAHHRPTKPWAMPSCSGPWTTSEQRWNRSTLGPRFERTSRTPRVGRRGGHEIHTDGVPSAHAFEQWVIGWILQTLSNVHWTGNYHWWDES